MSASSDRTARLRYCNTEGQGKSSCCYPKLVGIDPAHNVVCLDPACSSITADISGQTVIVDISGQTVVADISGQTVIADISGQTIGIDPSNNTISLDLSTGLGDAFSRLRISNPYTLFEFNSIAGTSPLVIDSAVSSGGAFAHNATNSYIQMTVPAVNGASVIRQSHEYILYQPGKSKLVLMTGVLYTDNTDASKNVIARIGAFDSEFGVFIQRSAGVTSVVLRNNSVDTNFVNQTSWNVNTLSGIDFTRAHIFLFDFEWLGVGIVRCGLVINGKIVYYHIFNKDNPLQEPYIPMAKLPLRYELRSTGSANEMRMICGSVMSEGGITLFGKEFTSGVYTTGTMVSISSSGGNPYVPLMVLRLRNTGRFPRVTIKLLQIDIFSVDANKYGSWQLLLNPTLTISSGTWANVDTPNESAAQVMINNPAGTAFSTSGGFSLYSNYYSTRVNALITATTDELVGKYPITTNSLTGTSDVIALVANHIATGSSSVNLLFYIRWLELI